MRARWPNLLLSVWLIIGPLILGFDSPHARANTVTVGLCLFLFVLVADSIPAFRFVDTALGLWLLASPFALGYSDEIVPTAHNIAVGIVVAALSLLPAKRAGQLKLRPSHEGVHEASRG
ncbi:SPW repeat protein [Archangium lansingense]|uniref:SPW repeat protein n=1 Tax=Archangium lansingense TaxID=2995310 RepID=A0ABT4AEH0_9BACT|nr:SPW repeat protein [Archangium lansinium]MCY1080070.1 SPW repeat protein [Archangium lansinium]